MLLFTHHSCVVIADAEAPMKDLGNQGNTINNGIILAKDAEMEMKIWYWN